MKTALTVILLFAVLATASLATYPDITVNVSGPTELSSKLFGHCISWYHPASDLGGWDNQTPARFLVKDQALPILQDALTTGLVRFPNLETDSYAWRKGVGPYNPVYPDNAYYTKRPKDYNSYGGTPLPNSFGADELMKSIKDVSPQANALITVNWWGFNRPGRNPLDTYHTPANGIQEAANWVEA